MFTDAPPPQIPRPVPRKRPHQDPQSAAERRFAGSRQAPRIRNEGGKICDVRSACAEFLATASEFYEVPKCGVRVLAARLLRTREHGTFELFGDYAPDSMLIRVWMRTAVRQEVTSFGSFLSTLCHEFCHHLDFRKFGFVDSWHSQGFYKRAGVLYHHARGTPLKKLFWVPVTGGRLRIDWQRTNRGE